MVARFALDKHWISFKLNELKNFLYIFYMIMNRFFINALGDDHAYGNAVTASYSYVEPAPISSKFNIYRQVFDKHKSPV